MKDLRCLFYEKYVLKKEKINLTIFNVIILYYYLFIFVTDIVNTLAVDFIYIQYYIN